MVLEQVAPAASSVKRGTHTFFVVCLPPSFGSGRARLLLNELDRGGIPIIVHRLEDPPVTAFTTLRP